MSKNFETEYKKYADNTVPDLWSRIEAGIDAYEESIKNTEAGSDEKKTGKIVNIEDYNKNKATDTKEDKVDKTKKKINMKPYLGALAACACMFLVVVVMKNVISSGNAAATAESAAPAAAPAMEAASDSADNFEAKSEEAYEEAAEESIEAYADDLADESDAFEAESQAAAEEAPAMEYEESAEAEDKDLSVYSTGDSDMTFANDTITNGTQAASALKEEKKSSERGVDKEITLMAVPDMTTFKDDGSLDIKVTDPLDTGLKKEEIITVHVPKDRNGKFVNAGTDISTIDGSESRMFKVTLTVSDDGEYILTAIE